MDCSHKSCALATYEDVVIGNMHFTTYPWECNANNVLYIARCHLCQNNQFYCGRVWEGKPGKEPNTIRDRFNSTRSQILRHTHKRPCKLVRHFWDKHPGLNIDDGHITVAVVSERFETEDELAEGEAELFIDLGNACGRDRFINVNVPARRR
jgi:hypothetical protein